MPVMWYYYAYSALVGRHMTGDSMERSRRLLDALRRTPYMTADNLVRAYRLPRTDVRRRLNGMEERGFISHVRHALLRRRSARRYCLTGDGVAELATLTGASVDTLMSHRGGTYKGLAYLRKRLDILACAYQVVAAIAASYESGTLPVTVYTDGPIDAAVQLPGQPDGSRDPFWVGVMVARPEMGKSLEERLEGYRVRENMWEGRPAHSRPATLFVVTPDRLADRRMAQKVDRLYKQYTFIAPAPDVKSADASVWREPDEYDEGTWTLKEALQTTRGEDGDRPDAPASQPYKRAALPRRMPPPGPDLTIADKKVVYTLADWPLATAAQLAIFAGLGEAKVLASMTALRKHGLAHSAVTDPDILYGLTDKGCALIAEAARGSVKDALRSWSSEPDERGRFAGSRLRTRWGERRHTAMIYDTVARFGKVARRRHGVDFALIPDHQNMITFPVEGYRFPRKIVPDATIMLQRVDRRDVLLLEVEQGNLSFTEMKQRLLRYGLYFETDRPYQDFGEWPYIAVVLKDSAFEGRFLVAQRQAELEDMPILTTTPERLDHNPLGPFGAVWRTPTNLAALIEFENWDLVEQE